MNEAIAPTAVQLKAILLHAKNRPVHIKCHDKSLRGQPHRARLLAVVNDETATIQPHGHGHTEDVLIDTLRFWKGGNLHIPDMDDAIKSAAVVLATNFGGGLSKLRGEFSIISEKMQGAWCGERFTWRSDLPRNIVVWSEQATASKAVEKLNRSPMTKDAKVVTKSEALAYLGTFVSTPKSAPELIPATVIPKAPAPEPTPLKEDKPIVSAGSKKSGVHIDFTELLGMDVDAILEEKDDEDDAELMDAVQNLERAKQDRQEKGNKFKDVKARVEQQLSIVANEFKAAHELVEQLEAKVDDLTSNKKVRKPSSSPRPARTQKEQKEAIRAEIMRLARVHSRLSRSAFYDKIKANFPELSNASMGQFISSLVKEGDLAQDDHDHFSMGARSKAAAA